VVCYTARAFGSRLFVALLARSLTLNIVYHYITKLSNAAAWQVGLPNGGHTNLSARTSSGSTPRGIRIPGPISPEPGQGRFCSEAHPSVAPAQAQGKVVQPDPLPPDEVMDRRPQPGIRVGNTSFCLHHPCSTTILTKPRFVALSLGVNLGPRHGSPITAVASSYLYSIAYYLSATLSSAKGPDPPAAQSSILPGVPRHSYGWLEAILSTAAIRWAAVVN